MRRVCSLIQVSRCGLSVARESSLTTIVDVAGSTLPSGAMVKPPLTACVAPIASLGSVAVISCSRTMKRASLPVSARMESLPASVSPTATPSPRATMQISACWRGWCLGERHGGNEDGDGNPAGDTTKHACRLQVCDESLLQDTAGGDARLQAGTVIARDAPPRRA